MLLLVSIWDVRAQSSQGAKPLYIWQTGMVQPSVISGGGQEDVMRLGGPASWPRALPM